MLELAASGLWERALSPPRFPSSAPIHSPPPSALRAHFPSFPPSFHIIPPLAYLIIITSSLLVDLRRFA